MSVESLKLRRRRKILLNTSNCALESSQFFCVVLQSAVHNGSDERHGAVKEHCLSRKERQSWDSYLGPGRLLKYGVRGCCVEVEFLTLITSASQYNTATTSLPFLEGQKGGSCGCLEHIVYAFASQRRTLKVFSCSDLVGNFRRLSATHKVL